MRVALFTETFLPKLDGIVTVICLLLDHFAKRGIESVIVAPRLGEIDHYAQTRVIPVDGLPLPIYPELRVGPPTFTTYQQVKAFQPDIAHFIHPVIIGTGGILMSKYLKIPTIASFHLDLANMARHHGVPFMASPINLMTRILFNSADYCLAPSRLVQREMHALGIPHVGLWGRGVDAEKFNPRYRSSSMREQLSDGHPDETILLYVGRLSQEKQINKLRHVLEQVPNTRLALVGDGPYREQLEAEFNGLNVQFMGYLKGEALSQAYASADIFVFPSALETFGLVVTEAMAAGLPVVASRVGGVCDVVQEGITGYTFEPEDVSALVDGVRKIAASRANITQMGIVARQFAETQTWESMMDAVIELYAALISQHSLEAAIPD